jgi:hypothetical protein
MAAKHIATYPLYGSNPITGRIWKNRIGTGYINKPEQIEPERERLAKYGHPLNLRWRNEECRALYLEWIEAQS